HYIPFLLNICCAWHIGFHDFLQFRSIYTEICPVSRRGVRLSDLTRDALLRQESAVEFYFYYRKRSGGSIEVRLRRDQSALLLFLISLFFHNRCESQWPRAFTKTGEFGCMQKSMRMPPSHQIILAYPKCSVNLNLHFFSYKNPF
ncbi:MAG: hypothetical protein Q4C16_12010, partial [Eubacteriales bacterium]|nr:hypothetical protein [Eubacteriales bacterium]